MEATKEQKIAIRKNCKFDVNIKEELVQWATSDNNKTSLNDLSFDQANKILEAQGVESIKANAYNNWGYFDNSNSKHKYILSLLRQLGMVTEVKGRDVADINKLGQWLKSDRSPVQKPLKKMNQLELSRVISALEKMVQKKWK
ncbi:hypothetical protein ACYSNX_02825 [Myroides sp. LJL115]